MESVTKFEVEWSQAQVEAILDRVRNFPWPVAAEIADGWDHGCDPTYLRALCDHWTDGYDWRAAMARLNRYPQFTARVEDIDIHFVHVVGEAGGKRPLILSHGWPGSHHEFWDLIEPLAFPSRFGGEAADAFDLIIPSLPGFGFSSKPPRPIGQRATARLFDTMMTKVLGYDHYLAQGGDWGGGVASWLGHDYPGHCRAIHLNMMIFQPASGPRTDEEKQWGQRQEQSGSRLGAYFRVQMTKPQSIAWLGAGNPVGQAAWIAERFHDWSDLTARPLEEVHSKDALLTNIMIYVMTDSFTTASWYYRGFLEEGAFVLEDGDRCETPTFVANFPNDALYNIPPRSYVDRVYNIVRWNDMPRGGHFAALEETDLMIDDIRSFGREASAMMAVSA